jgi:glutathione S-transferase
MKLFFNPPSPYGRKVIVAADELGVLERLQLVATDPWKHSREMLAVNPVGKVPALLTDDGKIIGESTTICEYFIFLSRGPFSFDEHHADLMARTVMAQGVIDTGYTMVIEGRRPAEKRRDDWIDRQRAALERTLKAVEIRDGRFDVGDISLACGLGYLDFRLPHLAWRTSHAALSDWLDDVSARPSMQRTRPSR